MAGPYIFGAHSLAERATLHPDLVRVADEVVKHWDCRIEQGRRTPEEHAANLANGTSRTRHSKHVVPAGQLSPAMDFYPWQAGAAKPIDFKQTAVFYAFAGFVLGIATSLGITLRWGGDWDSDHDLTDQTFNDLGHFEVVGA